MWLVPRVITQRDLRDKSPGPVWIHGTNHRDQLLVINSDWIFDKNGLFTWMDLSSRLVVGTWPLCVLMLIFPLKLSIWYFPMSCSCLKWEKLDGEGCGGHFIDKVLKRTTNSNSNKLVFNTKNGMLFTVDDVANKSLECNVFCFSWF